MYIRIVDAKAGIYVFIQNEIGIYENALSFLSRPHKN